jgi:ferric-dicitrate binding protein FerR (iron transport regulator)
MNDDYNLIAELIGKHERGEPLTAEEIHMLGDKLRQMPSVPSAAIWDRVRQRTGMDAGPAAPVRHSLLKPARIAAAVVLLLLGGTLLIHEQKTPVHQDMAEAQTLEVDSNAHTNPITLHLPDGSKVVLCYGSRLSYKEGATRDVYLTGQAEFNVAKNAAKPFYVHSGQTITQVLGTEFNVMAWPDLPAEITLLSGKISVTKGGITKLLKPSQQVTVNEENMLIKTLTDPRKTIAWEKKDAYFEFDNTDLMTVLRLFAHRYHAIISNPYHLKGASVTGIFRQQTSLDSNTVYLGDAERQSLRLETRKDTIFLLPWASAAIKYPNH